MKRTRFGSRDRLSREAAELQRLATGLSESGGKLEDSFWESQLAEAVDGLLGPDRGGQHHQEHQQREEQHLGVRARRHDDVLAVVEKLRGDGHA